jgi:hypothetical protein
VAFSVLLKRDRRNSLLDFDLLCRSLILRRYLQPTYLQNNKQPIWQIVNNNINNKNLILLFLIAKKDNRMDEKI